MSDAFTRLTTLAFGRSGPVVASRSRLVVGWQPLAMSRSCVLTTSLTLSASAYLIFGIFGLTAKQPLLSTITCYSSMWPEMHTSTEEFTWFLYVRKPLVIASHNLFPRGQKDSLTTLLIHAN
jgi:hypothetical protein